MSYPKLPTCLGHFEFKTIRSPTVPQVKKLRKKKYITLRLCQRPYYFFTSPIERKEIARNFSDRDNFAHLSKSAVPCEYPAGKLHSSFRPWRLRSSNILCCYEFQPTYHKSNWVTLTYAQCPRLVWPSVRVLGKPSLKRGRAGSASNWQDGEECVRKHLKSS